MAAKAGAEVAVAEEEKRAAGSGAQEAEGTNWAEAEAGILENDWSSLDEAQL
jgi:hypothetical protein